MKLPFLPRAGKPAGGGAAGGHRDRSATAVPKRLGRFEVVKVLGSGGFGTVYEGWDAVSARSAAIKTYESDDPDLRARAAREAELSARLAHENVTTLYESGVADGMPYVAYELLGGVDLSAHLERREPRAIADKLQILVGIARGLEHAHRAGVVHRDIKPSNLRILEGGGVKIMDFGIAKAIGASTSITKTGIRLGSASYMSPEQISGDPVDGRSDIFSLGIVAYQLFAFVRPFRHESAFRLFQMIVKEEPEPLPQVVRDLPAPLAAIVDRAMRKNPANRFGSAAEMGDALEAWVTRTR